MENENNLHTCPKCGASWQVHDANSYCGSRQERRDTARCKLLRRVLIRYINKLVDHIRPDVWHAGGGSGEIR